MHIAIPHKLTQAQAVQKVQDALLENRAQIAAHATIKEEDVGGEHAPL